MKCPKCGYENKDEVLYCTMCYEVFRKLESLEKGDLNQLKDIYVGKQKETLHQRVSMKIGIIFVAIVLGVFFLHNYNFNNKKIPISYKEGEIFLKEFEGSKRVIGARIYFQEQSKFHVKAIVITAPFKHLGLYPKEVCATIFLLATEELVRKIYPENPDALAKVCRSKSLIATSMVEAKNMANRLEQINSGKLQLSFIPEDTDTKKKLSSIKKGDIIEVEGLRGNLLFGNLKGDGEKKIWCPELEKDEYVFVNKLRILDSFKKAISE